MVKELGLYLAERANTSIRFRQIGVFFMSIQRQRPHFCNDFMSMGGGTPKLPFAVGPMGLRANCENFEGGILAQAQIGG